jgi:exosortase D (VPLPA-CTERM-specific)
MDSIKKIMLGLWPRFSLNVVVLTVSMVLLCLIYEDQLLSIYRLLITSDYNYLFILILALTLYIVYLNKHSLIQTHTGSTWLGPVIVTVGLLGIWVSQLSTIPVVAHYSMMVAVTGMIIAIFGVKGFGVLNAPIMVLILLIPLPVFLSRNIISTLQYLSSEISIQIMRYMGISVFMQGNYIELGGLNIEVDKVYRYDIVLPLIVIIFTMLLYLNITKMIKAIVFMSIIPIVIFVYVCHILLVSIINEYWGVNNAKSFLQYYDGNTLLLASVIVMLTIIYVLLFVTKTVPKNQGIFQLIKTVDNIHIEKSTRHKTKYSKPLLVTFVLIFLIFIEILPLPKPERALLNNIDFNSFPVRIGGWIGKKRELDEYYINNLYLTDYVLVDYNSNSNNPVTLFVAYYASQDSGKSSHSPRTCLPGDGWVMRNHSQEVLTKSRYGTKPLYYNRIQASKRNNRTLVYYWYQQRGRNITNEFLLKWYLFWDALTINRTDGALVRLTTELYVGETWHHADERLLDLLSYIDVELSRFIPE